PSMPVRERLFKRTSSSGHSVRVFSNEDPRLEPPECGEEGTWCPPPECTPPPPPPPPLPEPGEQPDDPAAADAAVRQVVQDVFGPETPDALERSVDDPAGLAEGRERLKERYPEQSTGNSEYEVADLVFTSPTQAVFQFRAVIPNYATLPWLT